MIKKSKGELITKIVLVIAAFFFALIPLSFVIFGVFGVITGIEVSHIVVPIVNISLPLFLIFGSIFMILAWNIDILGNEVHLEPIKLKKGKKHNLEQILIQTLINDKYEDSGNIENNFDCKIKTFIKENYRYRYIYLIIKYEGKNLKQNIVDSYLEYCIEELKISEIDNKNVALTTVFIVEKSNKVFEKTSERMIIQGKHHFLLPVYVNLENSKIHFSIQGNEMWANVYKRLWNNFKKYIKDAIE